MGRKITVGYGQQTVDVDNADAQTLQMLRIRGYISAAEFENAGEPPRYSSAAILSRRKAVRSRYRTDGEKKYREIRLK